MVTIAVSSLLGKNELLHWSSACILLVGRWYRGYTKVPVRVDYGFIVVESRTVSTAAAELRVQRIHNGPSGEM